MQIRTVGISGSVPGPDSPASCYLITVTADEVAACIAAGNVAEDVEVRDWNIVMELGNGAMGPLIKYIDANHIDAVLISHLHGDHFADMSALYVHLKHNPVYGSAITGVPSGIKIWGPDGIDERARRVTIDLSKDMTVLRANIWNDGQTINIGPFAISVKLVFHMVECYAMRIVGPSSENLGNCATLTYTGDTDYCDNIVQLSRDCDLLLAEAAHVEGRTVLPGLHISGAQAGVIATEAGAKQLVLTHIPPWNDPQVALAEAKSTFNGPTFLAIPEGTFQI